MIEADGSPGGGSAPSAPAEPAAAATAPALDVDALVDRIVGVIDGRVEAKLTASQNATFAALRKAGAFKQDLRSADPAPVHPTPSAPAVAQAGMTESQVDALMQSRLELERVISSREGRHGLTEAQVKRLRSTLSGVPQESLAAEADAYLADVGLLKAAPSNPEPSNSKPAPQPATITQKPAQNVSDLGAAAPASVRDAESIALNRPREIMSHDLDALVAKHGHAKAMQMWTDAITRDLRSIKIVPDNRRQR